MRVASSTFSPCFCSPVEALRSGSEGAIHRSVATFCLIHGNWHDGSCWAPLVERLRARGHHAVAPDLPFDDPGANYEERARPALEALEDVDGTVLVVGHSGGSAAAALVSANQPLTLPVNLS